MLVVQARLQHDRVDREHTGMVGHDHGRRSLARHVVQAFHAHPEPMLVERARHRHQHAGVELRVEPELIGLVSAGHLAAGELQGLGDPPAPLSRLLRGLTGGLVTIGCVVPTGRDRQLAQGSVEVTVSGLSVTVRFTIARHSPIPRNARHSPRRAAKSAASQRWWLPHYVPPPAAR